MITIDLEAMVFRQLHELKKFSDNAEAIALESSFVLSGPSAVLDSVELVNFILALEENLADESGVEMDLFEEAFGDENFNEDVTVSDLVRVIQGSSN